MDLSALDLAVAGVAGFLAGGVNAVAGGGTLISFPALVALGVPSVNANITNTVALCPGYFGAAFSQRAALASQRGRLPWLAAVAAAGGLVGSIVLVFTSDDTFSFVVPFFILGACALLAAQDRLRQWLRRSHPDGAQPVGAAVDPAVDPATVAVAARPEWPLLAAVFAGAVYGGFFGAGLGIMLLAVLGIMLDDSLVRLNALKSALALVINLTAALFFVFSGKVVWSAAVVMAVTSLAGGALGGRMATRMKPNVLRVAVIVFGIAVALKFWI